MLPGGTKTASAETVLLLRFGVSDTDPLVPPIGSAHSCRAWAIPAQSIIIIISLLSALHYIVVGASVRISRFDWVLGVGYPCHFSDINCQ